MEQLQDKTAADSTDVDAFESRSAHLELWKVPDEDWDGVKFFMC